MKHPAETCLKPTREGFSTLTPPPPTTPNHSVYPLHNNHYPHPPTKGWGNLRPLGPFLETSRPPSDNPSKLQFDAVVQIANMSSEGHPFPKWSGRAICTFQPYPGECMASNIKSLPEIKAGYEGSPALKRRQTHRREGWNTERPP